MLTRHDGKNSGSLSRIWIKLLAEITDTNHIEGSLEISTDIDLTGVWTPIEIVPGEASYQEAMQETEHGEVYQFSIQGVLYKDRMVVTNTFLGFAGRKIAVIVEDTNDKDCRLLGEKGLYEYHARLTYTQVKEKKPGRNAYDFNIGCEMHHPAAYYTGAIPE